MSEYDSPWKEALEINFEKSMAFFFPDIHADVDWLRGFEFLDKELRQIAPEAELGRRVVDKLVKVWRRNGEEGWVLVHIEVQSQGESDFPKRMYVYHYRISDRDNKTVVSLAILGDDRPKWRPSEYRRGLWGCELAFRFPIVSAEELRRLWENENREAE